MRPLRRTRFAQFTLGVVVNEWGQRRPCEGGSDVISGAAVCWIPAFARMTKRAGTPESNRLTGHPERGLEAFFVSA
jgi:hypothetical protein